MSVEVLKSCHDANIKVLESRRFGKANNNNSVLSYIQRQSKLVLGIDLLHGVHPSILYNPIVQSIKISDKTSITDLPQAHPFNRHKK